ncbi:MAG: fasciclin domain-containing protein [Acidimicrobiia bacterium]|nr:fasciclin domain-containing protein [Acidimicrobiia bacterium]
MSADVAYRRYRRRILAWGAAALLAAFAIGATVTMTRVENDLEGRLVAELDEVGVTGIRVSFSGQDGTLTCTTPLEGSEDLASLHEVASAAEVMRGVRRVDVVPGCRVADGDDGDDDGAGDDGDDGNGAGELAGDAPTTSLGGNTDRTVPELIAADRRFSVLRRLLEETGVTVPSVDAPITFFAPSNEAFEALSEHEIARLGASPDLLLAILEQHVVGELLLLEDVEEGQLATASGADIPVYRNVDQADAVTLRSAGTTAGVSDGGILVSDGVVHVVDGLLIPARVRLTPVDPEVEAETRAAALQIDLDALTESTQLGFAPGGFEVSFLSGPTLDRVAEAIIGRPGSTVVVRGHTDSGGDELDNFLVSTARANAVLEQLVLRGVPRPTLRAEGAGAAEPVRVGGVEVRVASRRVDFLVETE